MESTPEVRWSPRIHDPKEGKMTMSIEELYDRALALSSDVEDKFLELGRSLRQLLDGLA